MNPGDMQEELKNNIDSSLMWLLGPMSIKRYIDRILLKRQNGQPISFTDIFGHLVGETLLKDVSLIYSTPKNLNYLQGLITPTNEKQYTQHKRHFKKVKELSEDS